jgi:peptidoglycan/LPS O-acetylase OafA/YrhL
MQRIKSLDGARGIAALLVVIDHFIIVVAEAGAGSTAHFIATFLGSFAVGLFFITSGFVVAASGSISSTSDFFVRRVFRLYPVVIAAAGLRFAAEYSLGNHRGLGWENFLMTVSLFGSDFIPNDNLVEAIFWTLTIEVKFYILIGLAYFLARRYKFDPFGSVVFSLLALVVIRVASLPYHPVHQWATNFLVLASTLPMLLLGWTFWLFKSGQIKASALIVGIIAVISVLWIAPFPIYVSIEKGAPSWFLAFLAFCILIYKQAAGSFLNIKVFQFLGKISFTLYASHMSVLYLVGKLLPGISLSSLTISFVATLTVAYLIHRFVEAPSVNFVRAIMERRLVLPSTPDRTVKMG